MGSAMNDRVENDKKVPAAMLLAVSPRFFEIEGEYDLRTDTWSNRRYETAAHKKHNEAM